jgi:hypothetical protein
MKRLLGYRKSTKKFKKYDAILEDATGKKTYVPFGDSRYETFGDKTGLALYKTHNDKERRRSYRARFKSPGEKYSANWFSWHMLW